MLRDVNFRNAMLPLTISFGYGCCSDSYFIGWTHLALLPNFRNAMAQSCCNSWFVLRVSIGTLFSTLVMLHKRLTKREAINAIASQ
jgi:hypothetical protein